ncbi:hypothetical protein MMC30_000640 [Trapelia coarctata]|nr:hypothetical protein [Trapelia coarctata]
MNTQPPPSKRALSSSPNQDIHANPGCYHASKRSKNVATNDQPGLDPTRDHSPTRNDPEVWSHLKRMSKDDGWLAKLIIKVGGGVVTVPEYKEFNRYYDNVHNAIKLRAQPPPTIEEQAFEEQTLEDFVASRKEAKALKSKQHISLVPPAKPDLERRIAHVTPASIMPPTQPPKSYSPLFMSPEPESHAETTITSAQKSNQIGENPSEPSSKSRKRSFDHSAKLFQNSSNNSTQPSPNPSVNSTAHRQRSDAGKISDVARSSSVAGDATLESSVHPTKQSTNISSMFPPSVHGSKARTSSHHQVNKGKAVVNDVEDEDVKFFAKYDKPKPTNQDLARYRQGDKLALVPRDETEELLDTLHASGVEVWEAETLERHVLKEQFGMTGPPVDNMMRKKSGSKALSVEKPRSNVEKRKSAVGSAELEKYKATVKKLQEKIGRKEGVISEKDNTINRLQGEVNQLKQIQTRSSRREQHLTRSIERLNDAESEEQKPKTQLAAAQKALEKAQAKILEEGARMNKYEATIKAREETDIEIEAANLRDENAALKKAIASLQSQNDPFVGLHFAHTNLFASPLVAAPTSIRAPRAPAAAAPTRGRGGPSRTIPEAAEEEVGSEEGSEYHEEESDEGSEREGEVTKNQRGMMALDGWLEMPPLPKPMRLEGVLAYRDATRDERGRIPRAKKVYKVGRNVAGELR